MATKNDENFIAFCDELRAYVEDYKYIDLGILGFQDSGRTHYLWLIAFEYKQAKGERIRQTHQPELI